MAKTRKAIESRPSPTHLELTRFRGGAWILCLVVLLSACSEEPQADNAAPQERVKVDPRVLHDVVGYVYMVPGSGQRRSIRVSNFVQNRYLEACGEETRPLEDTAGRLMQQVFPDLALIRAKGLVEVGAERHDLPESASCRDAAAGVEQQMPAFGAALNLTESWLGDVDGVKQDSKLMSLKAPMRRCMTSRSSLEIQKDVPAAYLDAVNTAMSGNGTDGDLMKYSRIYADCTERYFRRLGRLLLVERPARVEQHRETLERLAVELVAAGYAP